LLLGLLALTVACALLPAVPNLWLLAAAGLLTGLAVAPALITAYTLVGTLAPISARTEAFAWMVGAVGLGQAAGSSLAGQLTDRAGASIAFAVPAAGAALALVVVALLRRFLQNPARM
jgi:MFS family permease